MTYASRRRSPRGPMQLTGALVKLTLPPGLQLEAATPPSASLASWSVPELQPGQQRERRLRRARVASGRGDRQRGAQLHGALRRGAGVGHVTGTPNRAPELSAISLRRRSLRFTLSERSSVAILIERASPGATGALPA